MIKTLRLSILTLLTLWCSSMMGQQTTPGTDIPVAENISAFNKMKNKTVGKLELNNAVVTFVNEYTAVDKKTQKSSNHQQIFIEDESGAICLFDTFFSLKAGDRLNGFLIGAKSHYFDLPELATAKGKTTLDNVQVTHGTVPGNTAKPEDVKASNIGKLYVWVNATLNKEEKNKYFIEWEGQQIPVYDQYRYLSKRRDLTYPKTKQAVVGILMTFKHAIQINITDLKDVTDAIHKAKAVSAPMDAVYNLSGQRVGKDYKGIVISNGKKYMQH